MFDFIEAWSWENIPGCQKLREFEIKKKLITCDTDLSVYLDYGQIIIRDAGEIYNELCISELNNIDQWYSTNMTIYCDKTVCLPLGVQKENIPHLKHVIENFSFKPKKLVYMNFNPITSHFKIDERTKTFLYFAEKPWVSTRYPNKVIHAQTSYYQELAEHMFNICPEGHGADSYRVWESLYLGVIPIVKKNSMYDHFSDLPIIQVSDWTDVNPNFLLGAYNTLFWNKEKLNKSYWIKKLNE